MTTWSNFTPASVTGLQLWLDASDASSLYDATSGGSLVAADGAVARWEDKSGNGRHATQATSGSRPVRKTSVQGGKDVLRLDGSDDHLTVASSTSTFNFLHDGDNTVFIVYKPDNTTPLTSPAGIALYTLLANNFFNGGIGSQTGVLLYWDDRESGAVQDRVVYYVTNNGGIRVAGVSSADTFAANQFQVHTLVGNPQATTIADRVAMRRNGGSPISLSTVDTNAGTALPTGNATQDLRIGSSFGSPFYPLRGDIAEVCIYSVALSDTDRAAVESYLMTKWGIT